MGITANERFEILAKLYLQSTGKTAPGKDSRQDEGSIEVRTRDYNNWLVSGVALDRAIEYIDELEQQVFDLDDTITCLEDEISELQERGE